METNMCPILFRTLCFVDNTFYPIQKRFWLEIGQPQLKQIHTFSSDCEIELREWYLKWGFEDDMFF